MTALYAILCAVFGHTYLGGYPFTSRTICGRCGHRRYG